MLEIEKRTEANLGTVRFEGFTFAGGTGLLPPAPRAPHRIEFMSDSTIDGYGVLSTTAATCPNTDPPQYNDSHSSFAFFTSNASNAEMVLSAYSGKGLTIDEDTADTEYYELLYPRALPDDSASTWTFQTDIPDAVVMSLGGVDMDGLAAAPAGFQSAYQESRMTMGCSSPAWGAAPWRSRSHGAQMRRRPARRARLPRERASDRRTHHGHQVHGSGRVCPRHRSRIGLVADAPRIAARFVRRSRDLRPDQGTWRAQHGRRGSWKRSAPVRIQLRTTLVVLGIAGTASSAFADANSLNSSEKSTPASEAAAATGKLDFIALPAAGGTSDIGVGGGFFAALTRNAPGYDPYDWNIETAGFITFLAPAGKVIVPYADVYANITLARLFGRQMELDIRPDFTNELRLNYYGIGNASSATPPAGATSQYFEYARMHPELLVDLRFKLVDHIAGRVGVRYTESIYTVPSDSRLAADLRSGSPEVKSLIGPIGTAGEALFRYGLQYDDRDNEVSPHKGSFDEIAFNFSPGGIPALPFSYAETSINLRGYVPLFSKRFTLAGRLVGDLLFGQAPLFELSRAVDNYAIGGSNGVRGVPAQRYSGKVKVLGNAEIRARVVDFHLFGKPFTLGAAAFFDGGRVWADTSSHPELDGKTFGLKYGIGGGPRLMSGSAFVLRADVAWSPDATPIGAYIIAGECF